MRLIECAYNRLIAIAALVVVIGGCGERGGDVPSPDDPKAEPGSRLVISVRAAPGQPATDWTLTCNPPGGGHPRPDDACRTLAAATPDPFAPVPADMMCTQQYDGPQTATIKGTWRGDPVDAAYQRTNGCEIARWDTLTAVLGPGDT